MYTAAICEDEKDIAAYIGKTLANEFSKNNIQVEFDTFNDGNKLLAMIEEHYHYDMIFMDIEMPEIDGITICRKIRQVSEDSIVVFISNKEEQVFSTFEVQPFRFVRKSHYDSILPGLITALEKELSKRNPATVQIIEPRSGDVFSFDANKILYVEAQGKNCLIHSENDVTEVRVLLAEIEKMLSSDEFIKPHRSFLVNCKHIFSIQKNNIELSSGELIPVSRNRIDEVKHEFIQYTNRSL